jgi:hypothetical protein
MNGKFCKLMKDVLARWDLTPIAKLVHAYYVDCASSEGLAWPNRDTVARHCGVSPTAVKTARQQLLKAGLIERYPDGGRGSACVRVVVFTEESTGQNPPVQAGEKSPSAESEPGGNRPLGGRKSPGKRAEIARPLYKEGTNSRTNSGTNSYEQEFSEWWKLYPRKVGKPAAWLVYKSVRKKGVTANVLLAAVANHSETIWAEAIRTKNNIYIPHPRTWLNQSRWEDEILAPAPEAPPESMGERLKRIRAQVAEEQKGGDECPC